MLSIEELAHQALELLQDPLTTSSFLILLWFLAFWLFMLSLQVKTLISKHQSTLERLSKLTLDSQRILTQLEHMPNWKDLGEFSGRLARLEGNLTPSAHPSRGGEGLSRLKVCPQNPSFKPHPNASSPNLSGRGLSGRGHAARAKAPTLTQDPMEGLL